MNTLSQGLHYYPHHEFQLYSHPAIKTQE